MLGTCPNCNRRYIYNKYDSDYVHECDSTSDKINKEDVLVVGNYIDEKTNSTVTVPKSNNMVKSTTHGETTNNNSPKPMYRERQHSEYIKIR